MPLGNAVDSRLHVPMKSGSPCPNIILVTASPFEAQDYCDTGEELVEKVPMPH